MLRLYVSGDMPRSDLATRRLRQITKGQACCEIEIIDVLKDPQRAEQARILATPTLIKEAPPPPRRLVGDLRDAALVHMLLGLALPEEAD